MASLIVPRSRPDWSSLPVAPLRLVADSGPRLIVSASVEGVDVPMLVHANAGFTAMLTHDALRRVNGSRVEKESHFGLGHDLRVSELGRGSTVLSSVEVACCRLTDVPCAVFQLPTENWEGMLGVGWLVAARPLVDFASRTLCVPGAGPRPEIAGQRLALAYDERIDRFVVELPVAGHAARLVASTVADTILDLEFARRRGLELEPDGEEHGPGGAVVPTYRTAEPVVLHAMLGAVTAQVHDTYAYLGRDRPNDGSAVTGYLGADALLAAGAVLDFG